MGGLRGGMDHKLDRAAVPGEDPGQAVSIADVEVDMRVVLPKLLLETAPLPRRGGFLAEELAAHVIVNTNHVEAKSAEILSRGRTDEASRSGDDRHRQISYYGCKLGTVAQLKGSCRLCKPAHAEVGHAGPAGRGAEPAEVRAEACRFLHVTLAERKALGTYRDNKALARPKKPRRAPPVRMALRVRS